jgi:hypothetical protein
VLGVSDGVQGDADRAVLDLALAAAPRSLHPDGGGPLLGEGRGVEDEHGVGLAQCARLLAGQFVHERLVVPRGGAEVELKRLSVEVVAISDSFSILVLDVGEEPGEGGAGVLLLSGLESVATKGWAKVSRGRMAPRKAAGGT